MLWRAAPAARTAPARARTPASSPTAPPSVPCARACSVTINLRAGSIAAGCAPATGHAPAAPAALLRHPVLSTYPCEGSLAQRTWHIMARGTFINPLHSLAIGDW